MKNPLTSKERRGLVAVAAAALLCIGSGFIFRNCSSRNQEVHVVVVDNDSIASSAASKRDTVSRKTKTKGKGRRSKKKASSGKREKAYPVRSPLDEPCDINND